MTRKSARAWGLVRAGVIGARTSVCGLLCWVGINGSAQPVSLTDNGATVTLANGIVSAEVDKSNGQCVDLGEEGGPNLLANGGRIYFDANGSVDGAASSYVPFSPVAYQVITNTTNQAQIAFTDTNLTGFDVELHYVLRAGDSGFYVHTSWRHGEGSPEAVLDQSRMVIRCDPNRFTRAYSSPGKTGQMIEPSLLVASTPTIMDATYKLPMVSSYTNATGFTEDGYPVYTKYDWSDDMENHSVHGVAGESYGIWMVMGSTEYFNGGPTKANQMVHGTETTPVVLWVFQGQHFGSSPIRMEAGEAWTKINGPYWIHVNSGTNAAELWEEAQTRAVQEQALWPYDWLSDTHYPVKRGTIRGVLRITGESTSNALVVLAGSGDYWQLQEGTGYQFWTRAEADGSFCIPKVRPGSYSLFARVPGVVGEFQRADVVVDASQTNDLGAMNWNPPRREQRLWRIGTPDLSAREFRFGDRMRQFGLWWRYLEEQGTNDLVFHVGSSVATDWYYAQSVVAMDDGSYFSPTWKVEFVLTNRPPSPAVLTVDLAGSLRGTLLTTVNGNSLSNVALTNDASIYRSATRSGAFRHLDWSFSPNVLQVGTNVIAFSVSKASSWTGSKPVQPVRGVMYDCVQLEAGALLDGIAPRFTAIAQAATELQMTGMGGFPGATYHLRAAAQARPLPGDWLPVMTNQFDGAGRFVATQMFQRDSPPRFYRLEVE